MAKRFAGHPTNERSTSPPSPTRTPPGVAAPVLPLPRNVRGCRLVHVVCSTPRCPRPEPSGTTTFSSCTASAVSPWCAWRTCSPGIAASPRRSSRTPSWPAPQLGPRHLAGRVPPLHGGEQRQVVATRPGGRGATPRHPPRRRRSGCRRDVGRPRSSHRGCTPSPWSPSPPTAGWRAGASSTTSRRTPRRRSRGAAWWASPRAARTRPPTSRPRPGRPVTRPGPSSRWPGRGPARAGRSSSTWRGSTASERSRRRTPCPGRPTGAPEGRPSSRSCGADPSFATAPEGSLRTAAGRRSWWGSTDSDEQNAVKAVLAP